MSSQLVYGRNTFVFIFFCLSEHVGVYDACMDALPASLLCKVA